MIARYRAYLAPAERRALDAMDRRLHELRLEVAEIVRRRNKMVRAASKRPAREAKRKIKHMVDI